MPPLTLLTLVTSLALFVVAVFGTDIPINLDGAFDGATATDDSYNTGGTISLNGWVVNVPKNMLVTFPAAFIPWKEFVEHQDAVAGYEINVVGNIVDGVPLAAQIHMTEFALEINQGYISALHTDGRIEIQNGPTVRLNDPNGVFGAVFSSPFLVVDDVNPSVTAFSGFPMCVPRSTNDTLCPLSQRPLVAGSAAPQHIFPAVDPLVMAPFMVGDFIEYIGYKAANGELIAYTVTAMNVQITTTGAPTYIRVEDALIGVATTNGNFEVAETRFIAYTSDGTATVAIEAIDINPCTGKTTFRPVGVANLRAEPARNKYVARFDGEAAPNGFKSSYTREYRFTTSTGTVKTRNGLTAGVYATPVTEWIQPELIVPGLEPIPYEFQLFDHLTKGVGPDENGNFFGPLDPFPQSGVTVFDPATCPEVPPPEGGVPVASVTGTITVGTNGSVAVVEDNLFVRHDDSLLFQGSQTNVNDPVFDNDTLTYTWTLDESVSAGPATALSQLTPDAGGKSATARFVSTAPTGDYVFTLTIASLNGNSTGTAKFTTKLFSGPDTVTVQAVTWSSGQSGTLGVTCSSNYLVDSKVNMNVAYPADGGATTSAMSPTPPGSGTWSFGTRRVNQPGTVTCSSALGGTATRIGVTTRRRRAQHRRVY
ncbi:hypothetical protein BKA62DRAFT_228793 [Auriculariales sp. MPI-PUGE-AT-0066]|nr:hypothetical protein BKA62DRAFT_228793 [Auriculariales sp. MPI-PUGE-AT-0066]